jgi:hypothetical protein
MMGKGLNTLASVDYSWRSQELKQNQKRKEAIRAELLSRNSVPNFKNPAIGVGSVNGSHVDHFKCYIRGAVSCTVASIRG